jgi:hypothetical protein
MFSVVRQNCGMQRERERERRKFGYHSINYTYVINHANGVLYIGRQGIELIGPERVEVRMLELEQ